MEQSAAGLAALALFVLWLGFWVPDLLRHRAELVASRVDDRFSGALRVLAVTDGSAADVGRSRRVEAAVPLPMAGPSAGGGGGERGMRQVHDDRALVRRPTTGTVPAGRVSRLAQLERRAVRARRRLVLTLLLLIATAVAWTVVGLELVPWYAGAAPTGLLVLVLVLGRIAVVSARRSDARWAAEVRAARRQATQARALANGGPYAPRNRARITGHAVQPSATRTQMIPRVPVDVVRPVVQADAAAKDDVVEPEPVAEADVTIIEEPATSRGAGGTGVGGEAWDPVPVPLPTYVTKPPAPRREPRPLTGATAVVSSSAGASAAVPSTVGAERSGDDAGDELLVADPPRPRTETLGLPLEQILARRRAAG